MSKKNEIITITDTTASKKFGLFTAILFLGSAVTFIGVNELYVFYKRRSGVELAYKQAPDYVRIFYGEPLLRKSINSPESGTEINEQRASVNLDYPYYNYRANQEQAEGKDVETARRSTLSDFLRGR
jgi:hypothetical protein